MKSGVWSVLALALALGQPVVMAVPQAPAERAVLTPLPAPLEREARTIERMLIAPCCWMQPVSEHQSQASDEVKQQVREWLRAGYSRQQVLDLFVARYGARILVEPPNTGFGRFLYVTPLAVFGVSAVGLFLVVKRLTSHRQREAATPVPGEEAAAPPAAARTSYEEQLDDELRDMD
jgi:cytochrome c-type biogenesis protein CcmH